jgi:hypothetical protein
LKAHTEVSRKTVNEDRIAICPQMGCETMKRVKPLKLGFLGFGTYPKCKQHNLHLVYIDERIGEIIDAALACLFDKSGLPPKDLLKQITRRYPDEVNSFIFSWIYCITIGRGANIISHYMDSLAKAYLKSITKKQLRVIKNQKNSLKDDIIKGLNEITIQYERLLKHLRTYSEVFVNTKKLVSPSLDLRNLLVTWLKKSTSEEKYLFNYEENERIPLIKIKEYYDNILNTGTCRCLLGHAYIGKPNKTQFLSAFDRFNAYFDFYKEGLTQKFTKTDIDVLIMNLTNKINFLDTITEEELKFLKKNKIEIIDPIPPSP